MKGTFTVIIVDDEAAIRKALRRVLKYEPYHVLDFADPREALDYIKDNPAHLVISDHTMPGMLGIDLMRKIRMLRPDTIRIMLTGNANLDMAMQAINDGAIYRFLTKPWDNNDLMVAVRLGLRQYETEAENRRLLAVVKKHRDVLEKLEAQQPGVTGLKRTPEGAILIDEEDIEAALAELEKLGA